ncbi:MAG: TIGR02300 family protein [Sphingomicrobium sp.]
MRFDRAPGLWQGARRTVWSILGSPAEPTKTGVILTMVKPEWGAKRTCPKCSTRFYDLGKDNPVHCVECHNEWVPEPVLKSKQPVAFEPAAPAVKEPAAEADLEAEELAIVEDEEPSADDEVDLSTGDDDLGVETAGDEEEG